jgi:hypothetical protein
MIERGGFDDPLYRARVDDDESPTGAVLAALESVGVDMLGAERTLADFVDPDGLDLVLHGRRLTEPTFPVVSFVCWGYLVVVTPEEASVYERDGRRTGYELG